MAKKKECLIMLIISFIFTFNPSLKSGSAPIPKAKTIRAADGSSFFILPEFREQNIYDLYESLAKEGVGQFISSDLVLFTARQLFSQSLRLIELKVCLPLLAELSSGLVDQALQLHSSEVSGELKEATRGLVAYLSVGAKILDSNFEIPPFVKEDVKRDLSFIEEHKGFALSKTLPGKEDFSQYLPRGHYTLSERLQKYFQAMMWFGRRQFRVEESSPEQLPGGDLWDEQILRRETRQMLLFIYLLEKATVEGSSARTIWEKLNEIFDVFTGQNEDLDVPMIEDLARQVWGKIPSPSELISENQLKRFINLSREATRPKIDSSGAGRKGFSLFGQRFFPDSYIFQTLVSSRGSLKYQGNQKTKPFTCGMVEPYGFVRTFPTGLDLFAALGSRKAHQILNQSGDSAYEDYEEKISQLKKELDELMNTCQGKNVFCGILNSLQPLLESPGEESLPGIFLSPEWALKELNTGLGSWVSFRHDLILYAKQSYTGVGAAREVAVSEGYVEPYPEFYRRIRDTISKVELKVLKKHDELKGLEPNFYNFRREMEKLIEISEKEVMNEPLSRDDFHYISEVAFRLKLCTQFWERMTGTDEIQAFAAEKMALVTDVHTDSNSMMVLEEGLGMPFRIRIEIKKDGRLISATGGIFSYFEFKWPMDDRLTDERWQSLLLTGKASPYLAEWFSKNFFED